MTGEKGGLLAGLRAEALKSRHAAPVRLAVLMALPMPLLGAMPYRGVQIFSAWNYWYALFLPVSLSLVVACVARADTRTRMRGLLGEPRGQRRRARALARDGLLRRRGRTPRHRGVRRRTGLLSRRPRTRLRAPLHRRLLPLLARRRPPLRARPPCRLQGRERPRGLRLARQQPLGRRGGHHRGPPVRGLTTQALAPACLATKRFHLETRGVNRETTGERE